MRLAARLWIVGALVPAAATLAALLVASQAFRSALEKSLDRALLAQAAVESVSLFDRPDGPHLHMATSPLEEQVRPFAPTGLLFDSEGRLVARHPAAEPDSAEHVRPDPTATSPKLETVDAPDGERLRELSVVVPSPDGTPFLLRLSASLAQIDASVATFRRVTLWFALALAAVLIALQTQYARRLSRRLTALTKHIAALREGRLDAPPPPDAGGDEVATLRNVLAEATEQLRAARETRERFVADAAHELRTPLTLMRTSLDLALRRQRSPEELRQALVDARDEVDRLAALSTLLLDLAALGREAWDRQVADLHQVAEEAVEGARAEAERRGVLLTVEGTSPAPSRVHALSLRRAIDNLVANALRFSPKGTTVRVVVSPKNEHWTIAVRDEGPGIPAPEREAVFEPFHRVPGSEGGTGLGLAIVREIALRHGGDAFAEQVERGASVVVTVPRE